MKRVLLMSLFALFCGCKEVILHDLTEQQANKALVALSKSGIAADKISNGVGWSLQVRQEERSFALSVLEASRIFTTDNSKESEGFGFIQSSEERMHAIEEKQSRRVEDTLKRFVGVLDARVHLFRQKRSLLDPSSKLSSGSASVLLVVDQSYQVDIEGVRHLVSGAVGIDVEKVSVVVTQSEVVAEVESEKVIEGDFVEEAMSSKKKLELIHYLIFVAIMSAIFSSGIFVYRKWKRRESINPVELTTIGNPKDLEEVF